MCFIGLDWLDFICKQDFIGFANSTKSKESIDFSYFKCFGLTYVEK